MKPTSALLAMLALSVALLCSADQAPPRRAFEPVFRTGPGDKPEGEIGGKFFFPLPNLPDLEVIIGPEGATGPQGATGAKGDQGDQGNTGGIGLKGDQGDQGNTGGVGAKGDQGDQGQTGAKGDQGDQGVPAVNALRCKAGTLTNVETANPQIVTAIMPISGVTPAVTVTCPSTATLQVGGQCLLTCGSNFDLSKVVMTTNSVINGPNTYATVQCVGTRTAFTFLGSCTVSAVANCCQPDV